MLFSLHAFSQTKERKNAITFGGGKQAYRGDLGNTWFDLEEEVYGVAIVNYNRYLNKSFDLLASFTTGDYGHCRMGDDPKYFDDGAEVLNMLSRLNTSMLGLRFKLANGLLLSEESRLVPYVYAGMAINQLKNTWAYPRVNEGVYTSVNGGAGLRYQIMDKLSIGYNLGIGYFTTDKIDYRDVGNNDMYMQNTLMLGFGF